MEWNAMKGMVQLRINRIPLGIAGVRRGTAGRPEAK